MALPDRDTVRSYLGDGASFSDDDIDSALAAETEAQALAVKVPAEYPDVLAEALCRRVARNLAMRAIPLGYQTLLNEGAVGSTRIGQDWEIRRLEAPYRRLAVG